MNVTNAQLTYGVEAWINPVGSAGGYKTSIGPITRQIKPAADGVITVTVMPGKEAVIDNFTDGVEVSGIPFPNDINQTVVATSIYALIVRISKVNDALASTGNVEITSNILGSLAFTTSKQADRILHDEDGQNCGPTTSISVDNSSTNLKVDIVILSNESLG